MSDESMTSDEQEIAAALRTVWPDGTDWVHRVRDDAAWAAYLQTVAPSMAPEFVYEDDFLPDHVGETYRGLDGQRRAWTSWVAPFQEMVYDLERIVGSGDCFISIHRVRTKARHSGIVQDFRIAYMWTNHGGRYIHVRGFRGADQALEAAGMES